MSFSGRLAALGATALVAAPVLTSCANSPSPVAKAVGDSPTSSTSTPPPTTSTTAASTTTRPGVAVPDVIGLKIAPARAALRAASLASVSLNTPCTKGTVPSQSVVSSLSIPGTTPVLSIGAVPLRPGTIVAPGTQVAITWSGCFGDSSDVPAVVGLTFVAARHALHAVGLSWACYSLGQQTTTSAAPKTTAPHPPKPPQTVLTQKPSAHTVLRPGSIVSLTMHRCPQ
jgi:beta-lactam-binding protein with PASTA domain